VIVAAALCPHPPLLLREVTGLAEVAADLRAACHAAVAWLVDAAPDVVVVVGADGPSVTPSSFAPTPVIMQGRRDHAIQARPLSLLVGARLLSDAGWHGRTAFEAVPDAASPRECAALGTRLAGGLERTALLVTGDGSARRGPKAPGYVDERALPFDAGVLDAVRTGDLGALLRLDAAVARDLLAAGRTAWQVLAGALAPSGQPPGDVLYADDPFGVLYVVCTYRA
jgi:hypothetical protein